MKRRINVLFFMLIVGLLVACAPSAARYNNEGNDNFEDGEFVAAIDNYRQAQQENPDLSEPYYNSGNSYYRQGNMESAATQLKQSNRNAEGELAQHSNFNLGNTFFQGQDWESAIEAYEQALRLNPDDQEAKYNLELALQQQQQEQQQQQQQQQQQGGGGGQPPPENQEGNGEDEQEQNQGQNGEEEQEGGGGGEQEQEQQGSSGSGQSDQEQGGGARNLTPQEAEQLLDALGQDSQTLQERLQEGFFAPGLPPAQDW